MKTFLKWAGNKSRLVSRLLPLLPPSSRFIEPFAGAAAAYMNTDYPEYIIADSNVDLINLYRQIRSGGEKFLAECRSLFIPENNTQESYYRLRSEFNTSRDARRKAALFLYLNRHCYNGLCRYSLKGVFNVPFGRYTAPKFPTEEIAAFHLKSLKTLFVSSDFQDVMAMARAGDVVYCDPPYVPLSATANFTNYAPGGFTLDQQRQLRDMARLLAERGCTVVLSNHDTPLTRELYADADEIQYLSVSRSISCKGAERAPAPEMLVVYRPKEETNAQSHVRTAVLAEPPTGDHLPEVLPAGCRCGNSEDTGCHCAGTGCCAGGGHLHTPDL